MYAGMKDMTLVPVSPNAPYPEYLTVYEGEPNFADLLDDDLDLDLDDDEDLLFDDDEEVMGFVSWEDFGLDEIDALDAGVFDDFSGSADEIALTILSLPWAGLPAIFAGPRAVIRRNARQIERRVKRYCKLVREGKGSLKQKALLRRLARDLRQYDRAVRNLEDRLDRRREKNKATLLLAEKLKSARREFRKMEKLVAKADKKICKVVKKKKSKDSGGSANLALYAGGYAADVDDDQVLMDMVGITQDDLDFLDAFGAGAGPSPEKLAKKVARKDSRKAAFQKTSTFFRDNTQALLRQLQSKAERAKIKAAALERKAADAARRSEVLALRSQEQGDLANRLARLESRDPQAPASPMAPKLSTGAMVGIGLGVAALTAGLTYAVVQSRRG